MGDTDFGCGEGLLAVSHPKHFASPCLRRWGIPERGSAVKWLSWLFFVIRPGTGRTFHAEAGSFVLNVSVLAGCISPCHGKAEVLCLDCLWSFHRVRSQSFFSWRLHLNTSLRASADPTASAQAVRIGPSGTVLFFATILRGQARPNHTDVRLGLIPTDPYPTSD